MQTHITLTINGTSQVLGDGCLANWEDISCAYKRSDLGGVVRSFTSKFDFVNEAYDLLLAAFLSDRFDTDARVRISLMNDRWNFVKEFECPLDFTTVTIANGMFSVSALDDSLAASIKAMKSTKYELGIGSDIKADGMFHFDRIPIEESVTYEFTEGTSNSETGALTVDLLEADGECIWLGSVNSETCVGGMVDFREDQDPSESDVYVVKAVKAVDVTLSSDITIDATSGNGANLPILVQKLSNTGSPLQSVDICHIGTATKRFVGTFATLDSLNDAYPEYDGTSPDAERLLAEVGGIIWRYSYNGRSTVWISTGVSRKESSEFKTTTKACHAFSLEPGQKLRVVADWSGQSLGEAVGVVLASAIKFSWTARGEAIDIPAFKPATVLAAILRKVTKSHANPIAKIEHDERTRRSIVLAAESVREIAGAKLYTSFSDFCDWMETVFGYTYYIGETYPSPLSHTSVPAAEGFRTGIVSQQSGAPPTTDTSKIYYNTDMGQFVFYGGGCWLSWSGGAEYNDYSGAAVRPYTDRLYEIGGRYYYFIADPSGAVQTEPIEFTGNPSDRSMSFQDIVFCHRKSLFDENAAVKEIANAKEVSSAVLPSLIYSTVEIGYEKKDYDSVNGRDEWNFANTYNTGCALSDRKLSLLGKYRADCYGLEFAAQKRGKDSTDTDSDNDVFCVYCTAESASGRTFIADRSATIEGTLSDQVFNAEFSPVGCALANAAYIGMQSEEVKLSFASSGGNSDVTINGTAISADLTLSEPLAMPMEVEFTTEDQDLPSDVGDLVRVVSDGIAYTGFINEVEISYARAKECKYKLLVKSMSC